MQIYFYKVFNLIIEFRLPNNEALNKAFLEQFSLYKDIQNAKPNIIVEILEQPLVIEKGMRNPSIQNDFKNGFCMTTYDGHINFEKEDEFLYIKAYINFEKSFLIKFFKKIIDWEYTSREEKIGQTIFERILVPATFFYSNYFPVHSSAFLSPDNKVIIIGGTGGVGKTSLGIEYCLNRNYKFLCDDMAILNSEGILFPNYSFPKIYGYNLVDNEKMNKIVFSKRSIFDRISWTIRIRIFGGSKVRRKINPQKVYKIPKSNYFPVHSFFILTREYRNDFSIEVLNYERAAQMNINVIKTEYSKFISHIYWHMFNRQANQDQFIIDYDSLIRSWETTGLQALSKVKCYLIKVPIKIKHKDFILKLSNLIENAV